MAQSAITSAFEHYKAMEAAGGRKVIIDSCVLAFIPDLDMEKGPQPDESMPDESLIVHRQAITRMAMTGADTVEYTVLLDASTGNFTFNWLAITFGDGTQPAAVVYLEPQRKIRTANGKQGNVLTYSVLMKYTGAQEQTGITTPASTWQIDFSRRLSGMDELTRLNAMELYGDALFFADAFRINPGATTNTLTMQTGTAYVRGIRVTATRPADITLPADRASDLTVSLDVVFQGNVTDEHKATYTLVSYGTADYIDQLDMPHFVQPLARIAPDGTVTDLRRVGKAASDQLQGDFLEVSKNLVELAKKGADAQSEARDNLNLGNSATRDVGTTENTVAAGDDSRITGAMQKDQNGADIPNKPLFIEKIGLKETLNPTKRVSIGNIGTDMFDGRLPCINIGDSDSGFIGSADGVIDIYCNNAKVGYIDNAGLHMLTDVYSGSSRLTNNGDVSGSLWGGWLSEFIKRNTPSPPDLSPYATTNWVNQYFAKKSTASLATNGWFIDASTGLIIQWGTKSGASATYTVNLPVTFPNAGLWVLGWVAGALGYGDDDWSNSAGLLNNSQIRVTTDHGSSTAWLAIGY